MNNYTLLDIKRFSLADCQAETQEYRENCAISGMKKDLSSPKRRKRGGDFRYTTFKSIESLLEKQIRLLQEIKTLLQEREK